MQELIVLMNEKGEEIGTAPKLESHHAHTPLHKAFSCYIFDDRGLLLVTKRAKTKKVWPGVWTNSVCGHPAPGESYEEAITRRAKYELGMTIYNIKILLPDFRYVTPLYSGIIENEICPVFVAKSTNNIDMNLEEVEDVKWVTWQKFVENIKNNSSSYSYWCKKQVKELANNDLFKKLLKD